MRWQSNGKLESGRKSATTFGPQVRFGTKRPSMTSTWIQSAPASSTARISCAMRAKFAERIEGAILTFISTSLARRGSRLSEASRSYFRLVDEMLIDIRVQRAVSDECQGEVELLPGARIRVVGGPCAGQIVLDHPNLHVCVALRHRDDRMNLVDGVARLLGARADLQAHELRRVRLESRRR